MEKTMDAKSYEEETSNGQSESPTKTTDESQAKSRPPLTLTQACITVQILDYWVNRWLSQTDITPDSDDMSAEQIRSIGCDPFLKLIAKATAILTAAMTGPPNHWPMTRWEPKDRTKVPKTQKHIRDRIYRSYNALIAFCLGCPVKDKPGQSSLADSFFDEQEALYSWPHWETLFEWEHPCDTME